MDPFACPPPTVSASWISSSTWALNLTYWRESSEDAASVCASTLAAPTYRGTWLYGSFSLDSLAAQNTTSSTSDLAAMLALSQDGARYDGTCVRQPGLSLGSATALYNAANLGAAVAAADFLACLESSVDANTGQVRVL